VQRPTMRFVPIKSAEQLDLQALHRIRSRLVSHRTAVINQLRGFLLECGVIVPQGPARLREMLPSVLAQRTDVLCPRMIRLIEELADDWRRLDDRVDAVTSEVQPLARQDECCRRLTSVPGIGALTASAVVATIGKARRSARAATLELGSGWCRSNSPQATERYSADSANAATSTCARYSSSGLAPYWQSPAAGRSLGSKDGWQLPPSASTITSWLRRLPTNLRALHGACSITAVHSRETSSHSLSRNGPRVQSLWKNSCTGLRGDLKRMAQRSPRRT